MVRLKLSISATLENVTALQPASDDFEWFFQVQCTSCRETHPKHVAINRTEEHEVSGGKNAKAHFVWRCGNCKRESSAKFDPSARITPYTAENGNPQPILEIECRGLEFVGFDPRGMWKCVGAESGTVFNEVDLSEPEWVDYD
ncbi:hypothetical protein DFP72DRAFT_1057319 [Ephemerocybe angulata]|uniref:DUF866-domain-containing protein n=1 Tax=Ephemerocybe angulata TaxID=980116 RepID=A0A8H6MHB1_9AGAR|nr:hypothetical protein DFP72DRAFT_1057319 [Tulosesus angulatus]